MKCPHCNYEQGWRGGNIPDAVGEHGGFYQADKELRRLTHNAEFYGLEFAQLFGCPKCKKTFIEEVP